jgi:GNAT superfamily N-acetyltransferase
VSTKLVIHPLTSDRWDDLETLFGPRGACGGCWCMDFRLPRSEFEKGKGEGNRRALRKRVRTGSAPPGLLAYADAEPVGWCAVAPRDEFSKLDRSRVLAPVDERPVWSIVCFFVRKDYRRRGVTRTLIDGAIEFAREHGADLLEAYPIDPKKPDVPPVFACHGLLSAFLATGFEEVARRSETRPIVRRVVD